jgi:serine/threonine-protein kinase
MSRYRINGLLGKGGMASVFEASRILPGNQVLPVACKVMHAGLCDSKRYLEMFYREAALNLQISHAHPGLVTVYDCFEDEEARPHLIMELVHGCALAHLREAHDSIPFEVVRRILDAVLDALAFVHSKQIIHRDISPGNVLVSTEGVVKLSDFGVAKHIPEGHGRSGTFRGTQAYASPEALRCDTVDARSDLFSVGAVLYEMLTGHASALVKIDPGLLAKNDPPGRGGVSS